MKERNQPSRVPSAGIITTAYRPAMVPALRAAITDVKALLRETTGNRESEIGSIEQPNHDSNSTVKTRTVHRPTRAID
jgi:hypothetical protein